MFNGLTDWTKTKFLPLGSLGLFIVALMEASFFPIPPDIFLIIFTLAAPEKALFFAFVTTLGSVVGGMFGYYIGHLGKIKVLREHASHKKIKQIHDLFEKYESITIFIASFTPIPYKLFTIAAGVFSVNFKKFVVAAIFGRGIRFFTEAILLLYFGEKISFFLNNHFGLITIAIAILIVIIYAIIFKKLKK